MVGSHGSGRHGLAVALASVLLAGPAGALELGDTLTLHGYGNLTAVRSGVRDGGQGGGEQNSHHDVSVLGTWRLHERSQFWLQVARNTELARARVDWAMLDWQWGDTTWQFGQVRLPFGWLNDVRDIEALRPTASRPFLYDEDLGLADEALQGGGVEHAIVLGGTTARVRAFAARALVPDADAPMRGAVLGARVAVDPPLDGVSLALSGYHGRVRPEDGDSRVAKSAWALSARWQPGFGTLEAEWGGGRIDERRVEAAYVQFVRPLREGLDLALRAERVLTDRARRGQHDSDQRRLVVGLAWALTPSIGLRLEWQRHHGHALPRLAADESGAADDDLRRRWSSTVLSVNAMF